MSRTVLSLPLIAVVAILLAACNDRGSGNLPSLRIATDRRDGMGRMDADKHHREAGAYALLTAEGDTLSAGRLRWMHGRGHSTWGCPKRPYNIKLEEKAALLSGKSRRRYALLANYNDPTALRNLLVLEAAGRLMPDVPRCRLVELVLNDAYNGLYLLTEGKRKEKQTSDSLTYCRMDVTYNPEVYDEARVGFVSCKGEYVALDTPDTLSGDQLNALRTTFDELEQALASPDGRNPETGRHYTEYVDLRSFALYYMIEEVYLNQDAGMGSFYVSWQGSGAEGRFVAGPVWDFDLAVGRPENPQHMRRPDVFYARTPIVPYAKEAWDGLLCALWRHADFRAEVRRLYAREVAPVVRAQFDGDRFDSLCQAVLPSALRDCRMWHRGTSPWKAMRQMCDFMLCRLDFLDRMWMHGDDERMLSVYVDNGWEVSHHLAEFKVAKGEAFAPPVIDRYRAEGGFAEATPQAWYYGDSDSLAVAGAPVVRPTTLRLRWTMGASLWHRAKRVVRRMWHAT